MRRSQAEGSGLVLVLAMAGIGIGIIGWSLPSASSSTLCQLKGCKTGMSSVGIGGSLIVFTIPYDVGVVACSTTVTTNCIKVIAWLQQLTSVSITTVYRSPEYPIINSGTSGGGLVETAFSADTEISGLVGGEYRFRMNTAFWLNGVRLILNYGSTFNLAPSGTIIKLMYSTDMVTWNDFSVIPQVSADSSDNGGFPITISTGSIVIPNSVGDVYISPFISGGNNLSTFTIDSLSIEVTGLSSSISTSPSAETFSISRTQFTLRDVGAPSSSYPILTGWLSYLTT